MLNNIDQMEQDQQERKISEAIESLILLELYQGAGIAEVLAYLIRRKRYSLCLSGIPARSKEGLICGTAYAVSIHSGLKLKGHARGQDYNGVMIRAMAQALGLSSIPSLSQASLPLEPETEE